MLNKLNIYPTTSVMYTYMNFEGRKNIVVVNRCQYLTFVIVITSMVARKQCLAAYYLLHSALRYPYTMHGMCAPLSNISVGAPVQIMQAY